MVREMRVAGIMSGTSLDGIDVAVVDIGRSIRPVAFRTSPYPKAVREAILAVSNAPCHTAEISRLNFLLPELYHEQLLRTGVPLSGIRLIGCHGQTIFHEGKPAAVCGKRVASTLQIGDGAVLAERTGIPVVSNFRTRDMAAGGQGAPLVPFLDYRLFRHRRRRRVALNLGGIANITVIPAGADISAVTAFDTGPANMVIDQLVARFTRGKAAFDRGGRIAARGHIHLDLLAEWMKAPYYEAPPPKSAGREQYGAAFVDRIAASGLRFEDLIATATAFTVATVVRGIELAGPAPDDLIVGGGGVHNAQIMGQLAAQLPATRVTTSSEFGIDSDAKEAVAFALLAYETWHGRPANVPSATGAGRRVVLGQISP